MALIRGVRGSSIRVIIVETVKGRVFWDDCRRQGDSPAGVLGGVVSVMAYESRR